MTNLKDKGEMMAHLPPLPHGIGKTFNKGRSTLLQRASEVSVDNPEPETQLAVGPKYESY